MAGIDKTYTNSYTEYKEFRDWSKKQTVIFFDGHSQCIGDWVWDLEEVDFGEKEIPIMNTPSWLDIYLIQNCKIDFVINRMKEVYDSSYEDLCKVDLSARPPEEFKTNRKIVISKAKLNCFPIHSKPYGGKMDWWLQCNDNFWYNSKTKTWTHWDMYYPHDTNTAHIKSLKGIIRHLRKQYLPKGITFTISGRYVGEHYIVKIK